MENVLLDPVELSEPELQEVSGGGGSCGNPCDQCNPCHGGGGGGPNIAVALAVAVAGAVSISL